MATHAALVTCFPANQTTLTALLISPRDLNPHGIAHDCIKGLDHTYNPKRMLALIMWTILLLDGSKQWNSSLQCFNVSIYISSSPHKPSTSAGMIPNASYALSLLSFRRGDGAIRRSSLRISTWENWSLLWSELPFLRIHLRPSFGVLLSILSMIVGDKFVEICSMTCRDIVRGPGIEYPIEIETY